MSEEVFQSLEEVGLKTQIWVGFHPAYFVGLEKKEALQKGVKMVDYLCQRAKAIHCKIALYNHGGWLGEPENQLKVIRALPQYNIGIIYNFHHGHHQVERYSELLEKLCPICGV